MISASDQAVRSFIDPPADKPISELNRWREQIINSLYLVGATAGLVVLPPLATIIIDQNKPWLLVVELAMLTWCLVVLVRRHRIGFTAKAAGGLFVLYLAGTAVLWTAGPISAGLIWLFCFALFSALFLGLGPGLIAAAVNAATLLLFGWLIHRGEVAWAEVIPEALEHWIAAGLNFSLLNICAVVAVAQLTKGLTSSLEQGKQARAELWLDKERFRILTEESPLGIMLLSRSGRVEYLNGKFSRLFGYTLADLTDRNWFDLTRPEETTDQPGNDEESDTELLVACKDGTTKIVQGQSAELPDGLTLMIYQDVSRQRRAMKALRESQERSRLAMGFAQEGLFDWDVQANTIYFSPGWKAMLGYRDDEIPNDFHSWEGLIREEDAQKARRLIDDIFAGRKDRLDAEFRFRHKDGRWVDVLSRASVIRDEEERPCRVIGAQVDISRLKRVEQTLREAEARYRTTFDGIPDAVVITRLEDGRFLYINEGFVNLTGYTHEETLGKTPADLNLYLDPMDRERTIGLIREHRLASDYEVKFRLRDGSIADALCSVRPLVLDGQDCLVTLAKDITAIKQAERERQQLETRLQQSQKMEALGAFAGGISHDFNNLLTVILGYAEMAEAKPEAGALSIKQIIKASERAKELVNRILTFSRQVEPELKTIDLNRVIKQTDQMLARMIPKMISIEHNLAPDLKPIQADANQLSQVIMNLAANAKDAMPDGGRLIIETVNTLLDQPDDDRSTRRPPSGDYVLMTVSDTGNGIDPEIIDRIFDPFFTRKAVGQGTGLGLATVYGIVKNHGGQVTCRSQVGQGASFMIHLPVAEADRAAAPAEAKPTPETKPGEATVLLVDDESAIRELGRAMLEFQGYRILTAASGEEALEIYARRIDEIDLIILDLNMPGMGGRRCLEELIELDPEVKVIISSGYPSGGHFDHGRSGGSVAFLPKPFRRLDLLAKIQDVLAGTSSRRQ